MSDVGERLDLRDLPAVEPVARPDRLSMTLLRHYQACNRSAFLYLKHGGGAPAHNLDFGTALHLVCERIVRDLIDTGQQTLYDVQEGESIAHAQQQVASFTAAIVDEVLREHPELTVPVAATVDADGQVVQATQDDLREAAYHFAVGSDIDPGRVLGLERKFVLDLECGWTLSGKLDVLTDLDDAALGVDDLKSMRDLPTQAAVDDSFQLKVYALLAMFGQPVEKVNGGEVRRPPLDPSIRQVRGRFLHPRMRLRDDGRLAHREAWFSRQRVADFRWDIERLGYEITESLGTGLWPAVDGSHCSQCPAQAECPLPAGLRDFAGTIESPEHAVQVLAEAHRSSQLASRAKREVRRYCDENGLTLRLGDREWAVRPVTTVELDKHGLAAAAVEAARYGTVLNVEDFESEKTSMRFEPKKLAARESTTEEVHSDNNGDAESRRDAAYGEKAPF